MTIEKRLLAGREREAPPEHDAATTILRSEDGAFRRMCSVNSPPQHFAFWEKVQL